MSPIETEGMKIHTPAEKKNKKTPMTSMFSKYVLNARHRIQTGSMLTIDPSSGSRGSMPGYAYFEKGVMQEWGTLKLDHRDFLFKKLFNLCSILRERFPKVDTLVIENIAPYMSSGGTDFRNKALVNLHKSIGAVIGTVEAEFIVEVSPVTWHHWLRRHGLHDTYEKNDANDALCMALCVLEEAGVPIDWNQFTMDE